MLSPVRTWLCSAALASVAFTSVGFNMAHADDTEIFRTRLGLESARPKVMIIFDNSGSMSAAVPNQKPFYNPTTTYPTIPGIQPNRIYWSIDGAPPPPNSNQWFSADKNRCAESYSPLNTYGIYSDRLASYHGIGSLPAKWQALSTEVNTPVHVDCQADVVNQNGNNGSGSGSPGNNQFPRTIDPAPYGSGRQSDVTQGWASYTLFTSNYMNWHYNTSLPTQNPSRIEVARRVIQSIIASNPGIDFGLATFNTNWNNQNNDGGRIAHRIIANMTSSQRDTLISTIDRIGPDTNTPLCETMYEVYRYLTGQSPVYGNSNSPANPPRDTAAQLGGRYISPLDNCQNVHIIYMTDGEPSLDVAANPAIENLTGKTCRAWQSLNLVNNRWVSQNIKNCLPELAEYMANNDLDGNPNNGQQRAITYTIGFAIDHPLLRETASLGGGSYYTANDVAGLTRAFQGALTSILSQTASFVSPTMAANQYGRSESLDQVIFGMFQPKDGTNWSGNIKKLRADDSSGILVLKDRHNVDAIDTLGHIAQGRSTFWNGNNDGPDVEKGGVGQKLLDMDLSQRKILTNTGSGGALQNFNSSNNFGFSNSAQRNQFFGAVDDNDFNDLIAWARGWTDRSATTKRTWIMGDVLHSRPVILDYGARSGFVRERPDLRIVVGTNAGFLHMFRNASGSNATAYIEDGSESWAFFPRELGPIIAQRRANTAGAPNVYGIDGTITVYRYDAPNSNGEYGVIGDSPDDRMWIFFGLRRGGRLVYGLDVTNPDEPRFLWKIDPQTPGFGELGQTWSPPVLGFVPGYRDANNKPKPVLIFGAGYDPQYDDTTRWAAQLNAAQGRGLFIVDAQTGSLVWSATPAATSTTNLQAPIAHPVAAPVSVLDTDGNGLIDLIYFPDVGGNLWRVDLRSTNRSDWLINRVAALAGNSHLHDRRFFQAIDVVRTTRDGITYHALAIGSGDRTNPNATDNQDRFYVVHDRRTTSFSNANPTTEECNGARASDVRCTWPIDHSKLYDATSNIIQDGTEAQRAAAEIELKSRQGWFINLSAAPGEKVLSKSVTIGGTLYFYTYSPTSAQTNICTPEVGTAREYRISLRSGAAVMNLNNDGQINIQDRFMYAGSGIFDAPSVFFTREGVISLLRPDGRSFGTSENIRRRFLTYWFENEAIQ